MVTATEASGSKLPQPQRMGHGQEHEMFGREDAQAPSETVPLRKRGQAIGPAGVGRQEGGHRMPGVALEPTGSGVVAGHDQHVRPERLDSRQCGVEFLDSRHLAVKRPVLTGGVGVFEVEKE